MNDWIGFSIAWFIMYLIFNVGIPTFARAMSKCEEKPSFTKEQYKTTLIPLFGLMYAIFLVFTYAFSEDKKI